MIVRKATCWTILVLINFCLLFTAIISSFFIQLFNLPFDAWESVDEYFNRE